MRRVEFFKTVKDGQVSQGYIYVSPLTGAVALDKMTNHNLAMVLSEGLWLPIPPTEKFEWATEDDYTEEELDGTATEEDEEVTPPVAHEPSERLVFLADGNDFLEAALITYRGWALRAVDQNVKEPKLQTDTTVLRDRNPDKGWF
jgi:hypothetical protein